MVTDIPTATPADEVSGAATIRNANSSAPAEQTAARATRLHERFALLQLLVPGLSFLLMHPPRANADL
jgi:hypothetical protein